MRFNDWLEYHVIALGIRLNPFIDKEQKSIRIGLLQIMFNRCLIFSNKDKLERVPNYGRKRK